MNYDKAHDLAHAMRESEEYKELMAAQELSLIHIFIASSYFDSHLLSGLG